MGSLLRDLHSSEELAGALEESRQRPVLLFKHSRTCPVSARALRELEAYLAEGDPRLSYVLITVQTDRQVSDEAAARLGVRHETPQAILVRDSRVVWSVSHSMITAAALREAITLLDRSAGF